MSFCLLLTAGPLLTAQSGNAVNLQIKLDQLTAKMPPTFHGLMTEEITSTEGARLMVTGDYDLASLAQSWSGNPAVSTASTLSGNPSTASYPMLGAGGNRIINTQVFTIPFPCSQKPTADPHYGIDEDMSCFGNAGPGSILNIPGTRVLNFDLTIAKNFPLKSEGRCVQLCAEIYSLFNHTMFNACNIQPRYDWRNWLAGNLVQANATLNRFTGTMNPQQMSMSLRFQF